MRTIGKMASLVVVCFSSACGSTDETADQRVDILDPSSEHYGFTYAELATEWVEYINRGGPPDCQDPINDATGRDCLLDQDPAGDVFFLVGTFGGVAERTECEVPAGKALFFPLVNSSGDNAGSAEVYSDAELKAYVQANFDGMVVSSLHLTVDGEKIEHLERGAVAPTRYVLNLAPGDNAYVCAGQTDVHGEFPGYAGGYYALLPPLGPGSHSIEFGGSSESDLYGSSVIRARYDFTID